MAATKDFRRQRGIATRQVGDADHLDAVGFSGGFIDEGLRFLDVVVPAEHQLRGAEELFLLQSNPQVVHRSVVIILDHSTLLTVTSRGIADFRLQVRDDP